MVQFDAIARELSSCAALQNIMALGTYPGGIEKMSDIACIFGLNKGVQFQAAQTPTRLPVMENGVAKFYDIGDRTNQCQWAFRSFEKPAINKRICGNTSNSLQPIATSLRLINGGIYQTNNLISEFCCGASPVNNAATLAAFLATVYSAMKHFVDDTLYRAIYGAVAICSEGTTSVKTVLDEATDNNGLIDLTAIKPLTMGSLLSSIESKTRNLGQYVLFAPSTVYNYLNAKQIDVQQPFAPFTDCACKDVARALDMPMDCDLPTLRRMTNMNVFVISVPDSYVQKSGANWVLPLINVNSLAAEVFAPKDSFIPNSSVIMDLLAQATGLQGLKTRVFVQGPGRDIDYNSSLATMFGLVAGRVSSDDTFAVIVAADPAAASAPPVPTQAQAPATSSTKA